MSNSTVAVICPMDSECELLVSQLKERSEKHIGGYVFYEGTINGSPTVVIRCLIGMANASVCTLLAIENYSPRCIILHGTSGAHDKTYQKNDIVIAEKIVSLANKMSQKRKPREGSDPLMWEDFGIQYYSKKDDIIRSDNALFCDKELVGIAKKVQYRYGKVTVGTVGCAEVWNKEADLITHYRKTKGTDCEAMEGVGVAQTCAAFGVPMVEIRVISNNELLENEHLSPETAENGQKFVLELLKLL